MNKRLPFRHNPKIEQRNTKLRKMIRAGTLKPMSKAEMREFAEQATERLRKTMEAKPHVIIPHETLTCEEVMRRFGKTSAD